MNLLDDIIKLEKIGERRKIYLNKLGIYTINDLINYFPRSYEDKSNIKNIIDCEEGEKVNIKCKILSNAEIVVVGSLSIIRVKLGDKTGVIEGVWFNQIYLKNYFTIGKEYIFSGKIIKKNNKLQIESAKYESVSSDIFKMSQILPLYNTLNKLTQKMLRNYIKIALERVLNLVEDFFSEELRNKYNICTKSYALKNIHFPKDRNAFFISRRRLVFEELFLMQLSLFMIKDKSNLKKYGLKIKDLNIDDILKLLKFKLTNSQKEVLDNVIIEMEKGNLVYRLIQGDVGSGKTIVAIILSYIIIKNGYQSVIMVPTDVLANQHYISFNSILKKIGIKTAILSGSLRNKEKEEIKDRIRNGSIQMIVGTHAIIQETVKFYNLGLVITDEQHRFGVRQREDLSKKGINPHIIVMSATPIPRTLALILYGDLDISIIRDMPYGRQEISTYCVNSSYRNRVYKFIKNEVDNGGQVYIVCPIIEKSENKDLKSVVEYAKNLKENIYKEYNIKFIHGKMKTEEKKCIMNEFIEGNIDIIVSTTVIEVGINVPNATVILIENAERFGISQLHQLRGRVGRGYKKSYCILITDSKGKITKDRMKALISTNNGFELSELDLKIRGTGDFFGTRQHGIPEFKIANLYKDIEILKEAQKLAIEIHNQGDMYSIKLKDIAKRCFMDQIQI